MLVSKCVLCLIDYNCIIILLSVTVFVCHDKSNVFCTINSPVYVYWKQQTPLSQSHCIPFIIQTVLQTVLYFHQSTSLYLILVYPIHIYSSTCNNI